MIIFFGLRNVTRDAGGPVSTAMRCPSCGMNVHFLRKTARNFIHIFWIPVIPVGKRHDLLECPSCRMQVDADAVDMVNSVANGTLMGR